MNKGKQRRSWFLFFLIFIINLSPVSAQHEDTFPVIEHIPITSFNNGDLLTIRATIVDETKFMRFHFRYGTEEFQVRDMIKAEDGFCFFEFDTSILPILEFEYYLEANVKGKTIFYPPSAPEEIVSVSGQSEEPMPEIPEEFPPPEEEEKKFKLPINISGSIESKLAEKESIPDEQKTTVNGNLRVFHNYSKGNFMFDLDSNFSHTNTPFEGEKKNDLSNMMISFSKANHTLRAGDLDINESEYSVSGLGRRGFDYLFINQNAYVHLFDVSSQQPKGFKGFSIPKSNIGILGGAIGYNFLNNALSFKAIFSTGKDDPAEGTNIGFSEELESRKGNVFAFVHEGRFFNDKVHINAEFARATYDADLEDDVDAVSDNAYQVGGNTSYGEVGVIDLGATYHYIGKDFNSIGYQFMTNNRKGYETHLGFTYKNFNVSGSYMANQDNVGNNPSEFTTKDKNLSGNISLSISDKASLNVGYRRDKQNTFESNIKTFLQDSLTNEIMGNLNIYFSPELSMDVSVTNSDMSSENAPENDSETFTLNLGGSMRNGEILSITPSYSYSKMLNKFTEEETLTHNAFLTTEIHFLPRVISLHFSGSYNITKFPLGDITKAFDIGGGLNFYLDKLIKIGSIVLTLKGSYRYSEVGEISDSDYIASFQCNIAL